MLALAGKFVHLSPADQNEQGYDHRLNRGAEDKTPQLRRCIQRDAGHPAARGEDRPGERTLLDDRPRPEQPVAVHRAGEHGERERHHRGTDERVPLGSDEGLREGDNGTQPPQRRAEALRLGQGHDGPPHAGGHYTQHKGDRPSGDLREVVPELCRHGTTGGTGEEHQVGTTVPAGGADTQGGEEDEGRSRENSCSEKPGKRVQGR